MTLKSIEVICLSRKDTQGTIVKVAQNNAALIELGAPKPKCKR